MSTTGGSQIRRTIRNAAGAIAAGALALAFISALAAPSKAVSAAQAPGEIVFANHGRIVSVKADGTGRRVLTRAQAKVGTRDWMASVFPVGDAKPAISPDGARLAFLRSVPEGARDRTKVMVADRDGSGPRSLAEDHGGLILEVGWQGDRVVFERVTFRRDGRGGFEQDDILAVPVTGGTPELLLRKRFRVKKGQPMAWESIWLEDVSADGRKLLYLYGNLKGAWLRLRDLETSTERLVVRNASDATLSPDGKEVAFVAAKCFRERCDRGPWPSPGLWTVGADGTGRTRIVADDSQLGSPSYSPDGRRIAFSSSRNFPAAGEDAVEIYSVGRDGGCLAWLTNGSPASDDPSWGPEPGGVEPSSCGANGLEPLVEITPPRARATDARPRLWAGPSVGGRLLSSVASPIPYARGDTFSYGDCGYFNPARCAAPIAIETGPVCGAPFGTTLTSGRHLSASKRRGGLLITTRNRRGRTVGSMFATGGATLYLGQPLEMVDSGRRPRTSDHLDLIDRLRRVGEGEPSSLPGPSIRRDWATVTARVKRTVRRLGSVRAAARRLDMSIADARFGLELDSTLRRFDRVRTVDCGKRRSTVARSFGVRFP